MSRNAPSAHASRQPHTSQANGFVKPVRSPTWDSQNNGYENDRPYLAPEYANGLHRKPSGDMNAIGNDPDSVLEYYKTHANGTRRPSVAAKGKPKGKPTKGGPADPNWQALEQDQDNWIHRDKLKEIETAVRRARLEEPETAEVLRWDLGRMVKKGLGPAESCPPFQLRMRMLRSQTILGTPPHLRNLRRGVTRHHRGQTIIRDDPAHPVYLYQSQVPYPCQRPWRNAKRHYHDRGQEAGIGTATPLQPTAPGFAAEASAVSFCSMSLSETVKLPRHMVTREGSRMDRHLNHHRGRL
jgi:hypothetical protein